MVKTNYPVKLHFTKSKVKDVLNPTRKKHGKKLQLNREDMFMSTRITILDLV